MSPQAHRLRQLAREAAPSAVELRRDLHRHPEIGWTERRSTYRVAEVLRSQRAMLTRLGRTSARADDARLGAVMERQLEAALATVRARPAPVLELDYPALVRAPEAGARRLAEFVGGDLDVAAMAAAVDPALHRQRG